MREVRERRKQVNKQKLMQRLLTATPAAIEQEEEGTSQQAILDLAILRHFQDPKETRVKKPFVKVCNESDFNRFMDSYKPATVTREWQSLECIQACIKAKMGLGRHIPIHFRLELDHDTELTRLNEYQRENSLLNQNPPTVKYDYALVGAEYAKTLEDL